jgi:L-ascorbate metabolism protein UlaG (beta-lactamase superfamily)
MLTGMVLFWLGLVPQAASEIEVVPVTHASMILKWAGKVIHVDPWSQGDYTGQPKADLILITDTHGDHLDLKQIVEVSKSDTVIVGSLAVQESVTQAQVIQNGEKTEVFGIGIEAVPMYNIERGPGSGRVYHEKGRGNGYVLTLGDKRVYISGDTECIDEMKALRDIDIAFICMNLPYTMSPEEAGQCVNAFKPKVVYPYHHRGSDLDAFKQSVTAEGVEVRILEWY